MKTSAALLVLCLAAGARAERPPPGGARGVWESGGAPEDRRLSLTLETSAIPTEPVLSPGPNPQVRRDGRWIAIGGYGLATMAAAMGALLGNAVAQSRTPLPLTTHRGAYASAAVGGVIGLLPGLLLGNESRNEQNEQGRQVTVLLAIGGTMAVAVAASSLNH